MPKSTPHFTEHGVDTCRLIDFPIVASGQLPQSFREWLGEANDQMLFFNLYRKVKINKSQMSTWRFWTRATPFRGWDWHLKDVFTGVPTSSRRYLWRRHLGSKMAAPEMTSTKTWDGLFDPHCGGGGKWPPFRFWPPFWMTSFPVSGSGNEVIQDGGRKRKGGYFPQPPQWGSKMPPYTTAPVYQNFDDATFEVWKWISNFIPHCSGHRLFMLGLKLSQYTMWKPFEIFMIFKLFLGQILSTSTKQMKIPDILSKICYI